MRSFAENKRIGDASIPCSFSAALEGLNNVTESHMQVHLRRFLISPAASHGWLSLKEDTDMNTSENAGNLPTRRVCVKKAGQLEIQARFFFGDISQGIAENTCLKTFIM